jgi:antitoxin ChpS
VELVFKKLGNATGLSFPASFLREHHLRDGQVVVVDAQSDGSFRLTPKSARKRYTAAELNAQCDMTAPMPADLCDWDQAPRVGSEAL